MFFISLPRGGRLLLPPVVLLLLLMTGCGGKRIPVSGTVSLDGTNLKIGNVAYYPDESKGNKGEVVPSGGIGGDGTYTLITAGKDGCPPGWYKVTVQPGMDTTLDPKYAAATTTPFSIEVKPDAPPGAYDLKLTSQ